MAGVNAVFGIDLGCNTCKIARVSKGGVECILNESSQRLTPALVSFLGEERFLGEAANTQVRTNMANTITSIKRLIGTRFNDPAVQTELAGNNFKGVAMPDGETGMQVEYCGETRTFSSTQVLAMLFTKLRQIVDLNHKNIGSVEAVISVPCYFTDSQRRAVKDAATIANLNCLRVLNDGTAVALSYGIFRGAKKEFPEDKETAVLFLDMGYSQFTATAAVFTNTSLRVLATASDSSFGGRDIDAALAQHFGEEFAKGKGKGADAWGNKKARLKLLAAAEKAKITLSPHGVNEAPINIECLMNDADFNYTLTVETLDKLMATRADAVIGSVIARVLATSGYKGAADFMAVELVGGSMRPRFVKRAAATALSMPLDEANGHGLSQSMNLDEATTRGCALASAMLSPMFKVKQFDMAEAAPYAIKLSWEGGASGSAGGAGDAMDEEGGDAGAGAAAAAAAPAAGSTPNSTTIFKTGDAVPATHQVKNLKLNSEAPLVFTAEYDAENSAVLPTGTTRHIGTFKVDLPGAAAAIAEATAAGLSLPKVKVDFKYDMNGCLTCPVAVMVKEVPGGGAEAAAAGAGAAGAEGAAAPDAAAAAAAAAAATPGGMVVEGAAAPVVPKKKFTRVALPTPIPTLPSGLTPAALSAAIEGEKAMVHRDTEIHATQDMRNSLEAAIYSIRGSLEDAWSTFSTAGEREVLAKLLDGLEEWLYNDGFSADKATYKGRLDELNGKAGPISARKGESEGRYAAVSALQETCARFRGVMENSTGKHGHLGEADRDTLRALVVNAEKFLAEGTAAQKAKEAYEDPVLKCSELVAWKDRLEKELGPIERRPVPPPPAPAAPPAAAASPAAPVDATPAAAAEAPKPAEADMN